MTVLIYDAHAEAYAAAIAAAAPSLTLTLAATEAEALAAAPEAEAIVALAPRISPAILAAAPRLRWIQALTTGIDNIAGLKGVAITNCHGIHGPQMTEHAVLCMLALARRFPAMLANQRAARWERWPQPLLAGKTACILGLGAIAEHMAGVLSAMGMRLTGVSGGRAEAPGFARIFPRDRLAEAAAEADFLIVLTPYSPATHHVVDAKIFAAMKPGAFLVNIARGGCVDEDALLAALDAKQIAGAALDVFAAEPLPPENPLWSAPGLIATPHVGGFADVYHEQAAPIVAANMVDYARGGIDALKGRLA